MIDLESKFIYYCKEKTHSDFSLMRAWKVISDIKSKEPNYIMVRKPQILKSFTQRWMQDSEHLSDSQQLFIYGYLCNFWSYEILNDDQTKRDIKPLHEMAL